jgi:hypothetical protein
MCIVVNPRSHTSEMTRMLDTNPPLIFCDRTMPILELFPGCQYDKSKPSVVNVADRFWSLCEVEEANTGSNLPFY